MKQVYRFKISIKASPKSVVRQIVSVPYSDYFVCQVDQRIQLSYFQQAQIRIMSYSVESEFIDNDQLDKELNYGF